MIHYPKFLDKVLITYDNGKKIKGDFIELLENNKCLIETENRKHIVVDLKNIELA